MNKIWFNEKVSNIEIPEEELFLAIDKGIKEGRKRKTFKRNTKWIASLTTIAASLLIASGFVFSPVAKVMANAPIIGSFYKNLYEGYEGPSFKMGRQLESNNLITELHETVTDNGVNVTITSAYYDGSYIGVSFKAEGLDLTEEELEKLENSDDGSFEYDFDIKQEIRPISGGNSHLKKIDNHYVGAVEMEYDLDEFPKDFPFSITFQRIGNVEGKWHFEVPVTQIPTKKYEIVNNTVKDEKYSFTLESLMIGESNMRINFKTSIPEDEIGETVHVTYKIYNDKREEFAYDTIDSIGHDNITFQTGVGDTDYILIYPMYYEKGGHEYKKLDPIKVKIKDN